MLKNSAFVLSNAITLLWSKFKTINNYVNHSSVFTKLWQIYDAFGALAIRKISSSSETLDCSGQLQGFCSSQVGLFSRTLSSNWGTVTPFVPMAAGFRVLFTCCHSSTVDWSNTSPTRMATYTCCFLCAECSHWRTVIDFVQCATV